MKTTGKRAGIHLVAAVLGISFFAGQAFAYDGDPKDILTQGLLGAGVGAISAGASGGKAGKGALIGAGTAVIGGALLSFLTGTSSRGPQPVYAPSYSPAPQIAAPQQVYYRPAPVYTRPAPVYVEAQPVYAQPVRENYYRQPQTDPNKQIIRQGLLGAGVGAISAGASGGKAGTGALIGAGTNVIGGALFDTLFSPSAGSYNGAPVRRIIERYDAYGNLVSREEV